MTELRASGGLTAPVSARLREESGPQARWHTSWSKSQRVNGWRRFFTWDKGWGFPLQGVVVPPIRDLLPVFSTHRGGIRFARVES